MGIILDWSPANINGTDSPGQQNDSQGDIAIKGNSQIDTALKIGNMSFVDITFTICKCLGIPIELKQDSGTFISYCVSSNLWDHFY